MTDTALHNGLSAAQRATGRQVVLERLDPEVASIATGVALPLLVGFALDVLERAAALSIDRLYFVARDGEVAYDITRRVAAHLEADVECHYLYGSRRSWQLAARGTSAHVADALWLPDRIPATRQTLRDVLALVGLDPDEARALSPDPVFARDPDELLGRDGWAAVRRELSTQAVSSAAAKRAGVRRDLLVDYLDQERVTAPGRVALVDVGWSGRASRALEDVLLDAGRPVPAAHLFVGLTGQAPSIMGDDLYRRSHGWLLDEAAGRTLPLTADENPVMLVETFVMGREGSTEGYRHTRHGTVAPQLVAPVNPETTSWGFADYRRALELGVEAFLDVQPATVSGLDLRPLAVDRLLGFWRRPSVGQARAWGAQPYGEDFANARSLPLAAPITVRRLLVRFVPGRSAWAAPIYWRAGSVAITPAPWRAVVLAAHRLEQWIRNRRWIR